MIVKWSKSAILDLQEIYDFIHVRNPYATDSVQKSIVQSTRKLGQFPHIGKPAQRADHRLMVETKFGYISIYRVRNNTVEIASVHDGRMARSDDLQ
jgi:toxin ParE1/3/4